LSNRYFIFSLQLGFDNKYNGLIIVVIWKKAEKNNELVKVDIFYKVSFAINTGSLNDSLWIT